MSRTMKTRDFLPLSLWPQKHVYFWETDGVGQWQRCKLKLFALSNRSEGLDKEMGYPPFHPGGSLADRQWSVAMGTHLGLIQVSIDSWWVVQSSFSISSWIWWVRRKCWTILSILPAARLWIFFFTAVWGCHMIWKKSTLFCSADQVGRRMTLPDPQFCFSCGKNG